MNAIQRQFCTNCLRPTVNYRTVRLTDDAGTRSFHYCADRIACKMAALDLLDTAACNE